MRKFSIYEDEDGNSKKINKLKGIDKLSPTDFEEIINIIKSQQTEDDYVTLPYKKLRQFMVYIPKLNDDMSPIIDRDSGYPIPADNTLKIVDFSNYKRLPFRTDIISKYLSSIDSAELEELPTRFIVILSNSNDPSNRSYNPYYANNTSLNRKDTEGLNMRYMGSGDNAELISSNTSSINDQEYIRELMKSYREDFGTGFLGEIEKRVWTVNNLSRVFDGYSRNHPKYRQSKLLSKIVDAFSKNVDSYEELFPLNVITDSSRLKSDYAIETEKSIAIDFTEVLGPLAVATGNTRGNSRRMIESVFGADLRTIRNSVTIHYSPQSNSPLYDSYIEYDGKVIGISSKGNVSGGASIAGLSKAIQEIQANPIARKRFNEQINNLEDNRKMYDLLVDLMAASDSGDTEKDLGLRKNKQIASIKRDLSLLRKLNPKYNQESADFQKISQLITDSPDGTASLQNNSDWYIGLSNFLQDKINNIPDSKKEKYWNKLKKAIITEIVDDLNEEPRFSRMCTWILNHSNMIQINTTTSNNDIGKPFQILDMVATWPSTIHENVELLVSSGGNYQFKLNINSNSKNMKKRFSNTMGLNDITTTNNMGEFDPENTKDIDYRDDNYNPRDETDWVSLGKFNTSRSLDNRRQNTPLTVSQTGLYAIINSNIELLKDISREKQTVDIFNKSIEKYGEDTAKDVLKTLEALLTNKVSDYDYRVINNKTYRSYIEKVVLKFITRFTDTEINNLINKFNFRGNRIPSLSLEDGVIQKLNNDPFNIKGLTNYNNFVKSLINRTIANPKDIIPNLVDSINQIMSSLPFNERGKIINKSQEKIVDVIKEEPNDDNEIRRGRRNTELTLDDLTGVYWSIKYYLNPSNISNIIGLYNSINSSRYSQISNEKKKLYKLITRKNPNPDLPDSIKKSVPESRSAVLKGILAVL